MRCWVRFLHNSVFSADCTDALKSVSTDGSSFRVVATPVCTPAQLRSAAPGELSVLDRLVLLEDEAVSAGKGGSKSTRLAKAKPKAKPKAKKARRRWTKAAPKKKPTPAEVEARREDSARATLAHLPAELRKGAPAKDKELTAPIAYGQCLVASADPNQTRVDGLVVAVAEQVVCVAAGPELKHSMPVLAGHVAVDVSAKLAVYLPDTVDSLTSALRGVKDVRRAAMVEALVGWAQHGDGNGGRVVALVVCRSDAVHLNYKDLPLSTTGSSDDEEDAVGDIDLDDDGASLARNELVGPDEAPPPLWSRLGCSDVLRCLRHARDSHRAERLARSVAGRAFLAHMSEFPAVSALLELRKAHGHSTDARDCVALLLGDGGATGAGRPGPASVGHSLTAIARASGFGILRPAFQR